METKFVPLYREPRAVVLNETLGSYGEVMGVKKFENGFFALRYENGVILYDSAGQVVDTDLDDVFVFKFGYRLFKKINSSYWYLVDANGNPELCYVKCEAERFHLSGNVFALCGTDKTWRVFQLSNTAPKIEYILLSNPMAPFGSVDLQVFQNKNSDNFVVVFYRKDGSILLHDNGSGATWTPPYQDNLITNPIGKYQMPLYRLEIDTTGAIVSTKNWEELGVLTIGNVLRSNYATLADDTRTLAGIPISGDGESVFLGADKALFRMKTLWEGSLILGNSNKEETITLSEAINVGELISIEAIPRTMDGGESNYGCTQTYFIRPNKISSSSEDGFTLVMLNAGLTSQSGFDIVSASFKLNGASLIFKGCYLLLNFANDGGSLQTSFQFCIKAIRKCYF